MRAEELRRGHPCPAQPSHTGCFGQATPWGLWLQSCAGPALLCPRHGAPAGPKQHPKPPSPCSAPQEEHKQFGCNSWEFLGGSTLQVEKGSKFSLGKFPAMLGTRDGLRVWALPPDLGSQVS